MIAGNLENVRKRMREACLRCDRSPADIGLVAVSKTFNVDAIRDAAGAGQIDFGENYAQGFRSKAESLRSLNLHWHFIGHLQSNKGKYVVNDVHLIHSLDRLSLANELQKLAEKKGRTIDVLVEARTTDEATKSGLLPEEILPFLRSLVPFDSVQVKGLMTMGPFSDDPEDARPCFRTVRLLQERLRQDAPGSMSFDTLSMGMTSDFEVAIEEGATLIRVGTAIFGQRLRAL